jgi:hypothetical protein
MSRVTLQLSYPFNLAAFDQEQPAGTYITDIEERPIEGLTFLATRRVGATLYSPAGSDQTNCRYAVPISLTELDAITAQSSR